MAKKKEEGGLEYITRDEYEMIMEHMIEDAIGEVASYKKQLFGAMALEERGYRVTYYMIDGSVGYRFEKKKKIGFDIDGKRDYSR